uniref:Uncharacterized protein n=3 Tax=unclassified bacterial viruses TaxID=12333 RepID=A0AAU6W2U8_9VIRU
MKLIDILARKLKVWPDERVLAVAQASSGGLYPSSISTAFLGCLGGFELADDWRSAIVTYQSWKSAVEALKYPAREKCECGDCAKKYKEWNGEGEPAVGSLAEDHSIPGAPVYMVEVVATEGGLFSIKRPGFLKVVDISCLRPIKNSASKMGYENMSTDFDYADNMQSAKNFHDRLVSKEWNGEGLPPVGTVCEFMYHQAPPASSSEWMVGDIRYISDCTVLIGGEGCEHVHHPRNCSFRPIRTAEQLAADERDEAIHDLMGTTCITMGEAAKIYDAGYRKQVQK